MKPSSEEGFGRDGQCSSALETGSTEGFTVEKQASETRAGSVVRQEKTGNVNFSDSFVRFGLGFFGVFCFVMLCL